MQFIESSIIGIRSAVTTLTHRTTPLKFVLFPMVHVAEQQFYDEVLSRARQCQLIVAEGIPSGYAPAQEWMARHRWDHHLVDQIVGLRLETLGVPIRWEAVPDDRPKSPREQFMNRATDIAGAATIGLARMFTDPRILPSVDQAEAYDESAENMTGGWFDRTFEHHIKTSRDARLIRLLDEIHRDNTARSMTTGVVFGGAHMPAVASHLCGQLGYVATSAEWLTVVNAKS